MKRLRLLTVFLLVIAMCSSLLCGCDHSEEDKKSDLFENGQGTKAKPYVISTEEELRALCDEPTEGLYFVLGDDIVLSGSDDPWVPLGESYAFAGTLDGQGHDIINLFIDSSEYYQAALFAYGNGCTIRNLTIRESSVHANPSKEGRLVSVAALFANLEDGTLESCHIKDVKITSETEGVYAGGLVGFGENITMVNCSTVSSSPTDISVMAVANGEDSNYAGGIAGRLTDCTIRDCRNMVSVSAVYAGGFVATAADCTITDSVNKGTIYGSDHSGGFCGWLYRDSTISGCTNDGNILAEEDGGDAAGIVSFIRPEDGTVRITDCSNTGDITANRKAGGIAAMAEDIAELSGVTNSGTITGSFDRTSYAAGIAAECFRGVTITSALNKGDVSGVRSGGICADASCVLADCTNSGNVYGREDAGGLIGCSYTEATATNCHNTGSVTGEGEVYDLMEMP